MQKVLFAFGASCCCIRQELSLEEDDGYVGRGKHSSHGVLFPTWAACCCLSLAARLRPTGWQPKGGQCCSWAPTTSLKSYFAYFFFFLRVCNAKSWQRNLSAPLHVVNLCQLVLFWIWRVFFSCAFNPSDMQPLARRPSTCGTQHRAVAVFR